MCFVLALLKKYRTLLYKFLGTVTLYLSLGESFKQLFLDVIVQSVTWITAWIFGHAIISDEIQQVVSCELKHCPITIVYVLSELAF